MKHYHYTFDVDFKAAGEDNDFSHAQKLYAVLMEAFEILLGRIRYHQPFAYPLFANIEVSPRVMTYVRKLACYKKSELRLPLPVVATNVIVLPEDSSSEIHGYYSFVMTKHRSLNRGLDEGDNEAGFSIYLENYDTVYPGEPQ